MRLIRGKKLEVHETEIIFDDEPDKRVDGFRIELHTKNTKTYILLTIEEMSGVVEVLTKSKQKEIFSNMFI